VPHKDPGSSFALLHQAPQLGENGEAQIGAFRVGDPHLPTLKQWLHDGMVNGQPQLGGKS